MNVNICFHTLQVSRYPQTNVAFELPSIYCDFWTFSLEIPQNKQFLRIINKGLPYMSGHKVKLLGERIFTLYKLIACIGL